MPAKRVDPLKQREARQKKFVAIGGVLLVLVFAWEAKTIMRRPSAPPAATPAATTSAAPNALTPPALPGTTPAAATPSSQLADTDVPPATPREGQLVSFGVFETKNPFAPQVNTDGATTSSGPASTVPASGAGASPADAKPGADVSGTPTPATPGQTLTPPATAPAPTTATTTTTTTAPAETVTISVNGRSERVGKDGTFPSGAPVFRLVDWSKGRATIGIVGGTYQSGDPTLTLQQGKPVTLMNTSDTKRYRLVLLATP